MRKNSRSLLATIFLLALTVGACGRGDAEADLPRVVATTPVLGDVVSTVVGDRADVVTIMPNGADPHAFAASASQVDDILGADLLVVNGSDLEEGLTDVVEQARDAGVPTFTATDHTPAAPEEGDPHFWLDPRAMQDVVTALGAAVEDELAIATETEVGTYNAALTELDTANAAAVADVPPERRKLVTGHDALGWWAARYGFEVVGLVVPSTSTQAETSARQSADLTRTLTESGVDVIFVDTGRSPAIADNIARDSGARVVELDIETLPADGSYITLVERLTETITTALR
ncbi:MAG: zinc ABC transporter substrate-binding protein [Acidimicrobiia bacterium]|nr:zinc ABC transporter substrate-binding protein [Acidimicrobiia bacterium]